MKRVALGMSGGVDSSVSLALLLKQGYEVTGVFLECWRAPGCRAEEDRKDALAVALQFGIPFKVLDFKDAYKEKVVEYFFREYEAGRTPNPDVLCNKEIKFGLFYDWAMAEGFDFVATGHYAQIMRIKNNESGIKVGNASGHNSSFLIHNSVFSLVRSADSWKDQTYFLYRLREDQLPHILFPVGHLLKSEVRLLASSYKLSTATKPDSQGICFIGDINVHNFLKERLGERPGDVVDMKGNKIGEHKGLWFYTIGQRHGFDNAFQVKNEVGIDKHMIPPFYVIRKDAANNRLVVCFGAETYRDNFKIEDVHWIDTGIKNNESGIRVGNASDHNSSFFIHNPLLVRIRHTGKLLPCLLNGNQVKLTDPVQGIASGQSAVFYAGEVCLGGGIISDL